MTDLPLTEMVKVSLPNRTFTPPVELSLPVPLKFTTLGAGRVTAFICGTGERGEIVTGIG